VSEALAEKLTARRATEKPWMMSFGKLRSLRKSAHVDLAVNDEFEKNRT